MPVVEPSVLFICTANMCRSPTAEAIFEGMLRERGEIDNWWVDSAGTHALDGERATEFSRAVVAERGGDLERHRSKSVDRRLLDAFGIVIVMEPMHRDHLAAAHPELTGRIHLLTELAGESGPIVDPVGGSLAEYRAMADRVTDLLVRSYERIRALAGGVERAENAP